MHEMGIASSVLEAVHKELRLYPGQRAGQSRIRIGEFAGVDAESLRFCFEVLVGPELALEIETSAVEEPARRRTGAGVSRTGRGSEGASMNGCRMEKKVLSENDQIAARLRDALAAAGRWSLNFIGSPGAGKTALLERTLEHAALHTRAAVLTGDIQTENDARRFARYGYPVRQITTAGACHLDARMVEKHLADWLDEGLELLLIENVGNLVCPTSYDLGEDAKIVVLSVAEGEDKPLKYPGIFRKAELMILNKIDLLPHVPFKLELARENARSINPGIEIIETSCTTGAGLDQWLTWLAGAGENVRSEGRRPSERRLAEARCDHDN